MKNDLSAYRLRELVTYDPQTGFFVRKKTAHYNAKAAWIMVRGRRRYLGLFEVPELAHAAYCAAAVKGFREFART